MLRGCSGFYSYAIYEHLQEWPAFNLDETRLAFKLRKDKQRLKFFINPSSYYNNIIVVPQSQRIYMGVVQVPLHGHG